MPCLRNFNKHKSYNDSIMIPIDAILDSTCMSKPEHEYKNVCLSELQGKLTLIKM